MLLNYEELTPVKKSVEVEIPADLISNEAKRGGSSPPFRTNLEC